MIAMSNTRIWFVLLLIALAVSVMAIVPGLAGIPLTRHAQQSHADEKYSPANILETMNNGGCGPVTAYICAETDQVIYVCNSPTNNKKSLGLITGYSVKQVVTGYSADTKQWEKKVETCKSVPGATP